MYHDLLKNKFSIQIFNFLYKTILHLIIIASISSNGPNIPFPDKKNIAFITIVCNGYRVRL